MSLTERQWQRQVLDAARYCGWLRAHFRPAQTARGWRTPVEGDGAGFPDLVLVRGHRLLFVELKSDRGRVSPAQQAWLDALRRASVEVHVWRPSDWARVEEVLR